MAASRLSEPPKKSSPVGMIVVLLLLAVGAGVVTWLLYPSEPPAAPRRPTPPPRPSTALVDVPVEEPVAPPIEQTEDAGADDADVAESTSPVAKRTNGRRRALPEGTIDRRRLRAFIQTKSGQVRQCYERRLKANNMLQGVLVPQIRIHPNGSVTSITYAQDTLHDQEVKNCVTRVIRSWRFPQPEGGAVTVAPPFRFAPRND